MNTFRAVLEINPLVGLVFIFFGIIVCLVFYIISKRQIIFILQRKLRYLEDVVKDLDQQAKLIIKSDVELKLYQQKVEEELYKLTLVKKIITSTMHILDKEELFSQIDKKAINNLGFKKGLILDFEDLSLKSNTEFEETEIKKIRDIIKDNRELLKTHLFLPRDSKVYKKLRAEMETNEILIAPIKIKEHTYAIFIASNLILPTEIKKSDEEAFLIICMYIGQCLDKIRLFESLYQTKDELEKKIKERTNELVKSLKSIEVINKAKSDFVSSVSHELRTPLTSVKGFSSLLVDEKFGKLPEEAKKRLIRIDENVNTLMHIVNTLLDISRIESGKMEIKIGPFEIVKLIKDVTDFLSPQIEAKSLHLELDTPEKLNTFIDKSLIERVLINLINNAIKFTPQEGRINIKCAKKDGKAIVSISDTGYGIERNDLEKIFQEFYRVNNPEVNLSKGSGLGLSLVKQIIDTHKEKIWVESKVGKGTIFNFTLRLGDNE